MKTLLLLLLSVSLATASELTDLQAKYNKASAKALEPINVVYTTELQKLLEKYSKDGNIEEVAKITDELKKFVTVSADTVNVPKNKIIGKWESNAGTLFVFDKNGKGYKKFGTNETVLSWRLLPSGVIEFSGRDTVNSPTRTWFVKLIDNKHATYGNTENDLPLSLIKQ